MAKVIENGRITSMVVEHAGSQFNIWRFDRKAPEYEVFCNRRGGQQEETSETLEIRTTEDPQIPAPNERVIYKICSEKGKVDRDNPKTENDWGRCSEEKVCPLGTEHESSFSIHRNKIELTEQSHL